MVRESCEAASLSGRVWFETRERSTMSTLEEESRKLARQIYGAKLELRSVGHDGLGRNYVYSAGDREIFKVYPGRKENWAREIHALRFLSGHQLPTPQIIDHGATGSLYWTRITVLNGKPITECLPRISESDLRLITEGMGSLLGRIHSCGSFHYWVTWNGSEIMETNRYRYNQHLKERAEKSMAILRFRGGDQVKLYERAFEKITLADLDWTESVPCHYDFSYRNVLVLQEDSRWQISGIIDFERSRPEFLPQRFRGA